VCHIRGERRGKEKEVENCVQVCIFLVDTLKFFYSIQVARLKLMYKCTKIDLVDILKVLVQH
jgi:hypothetical protein